MHSRTCGKNQKHKELNDYGKRSQCRFSIFKLNITLAHNCRRNISKGQTVKSKITELQQIKLTQGLYENFMAPSQRHADEETNTRPRQTPNTHGTITATLTG